jgi:hypothetical protein
VQSEAAEHIMQNQRRARFIICGAVLMRNVFAYTLVAINTTAVRSLAFPLYSLLCAHRDKQAAGRPASGVIFCTPVLKVLQVRLIEKLSCQIFLNMVTILNRN